MKQLRAWFSLSAGVLLAFLVVSLVMAGEKGGEESQTLPPDMITLPPGPDGQDVIEIPVFVTQASDQGATITVNSPADTVIATDNECTLREAINNANTNSDTTGGDCTSGSSEDVIVLPAGTYTLTIPGINDNFNASGDLDILDIQYGLTIEGASAQTTIVDGNEIERVFHVLNLRSLTLNGLTISGGYVLGGTLGGGGILNERGTLTVTDSIVQDNVASGFKHGGGIYNLGGQASIINSIIQRNQVIANGFYGGGGLANAASINSASVTLMNTQVISNSAPGAGGILNGVGSNVTATLRVLSSTVAYNVAQPSFPGWAAPPGGGIWDTPFSSAVNPATVLYIDGSDIHHNTVITGCCGGGITSWILPNSTATIRRSMIRDNQAIGGGPNSGVGGGAFFQSTAVFIDSSTIAGNVVSGTYNVTGLGGGLYLQNATATVVNSTISGNKAQEGDPVPASNGQGGGVYMNTVTAAFTNTTVANNVSADTGGGLATLNSGLVSFVNTIFAGNTAPVGSNCGELSPTIWSSLGHNLEDDDTCHFDQPTDLTDTNPLLDVLQDNGGPTLTQALLFGSPAVDAGDTITCTASPVNGTDQRGITRPKGAECDIGAYEVEAVAGLAAVNDGPTSLGDSTTFTATVTAGDMASYTWDFGDGNTGSGAVASHTYLMPGTYTATVTATNPINSMMATTVVMVIEPETDWLIYLPVILNMP